MFKKYNVMILLTLLTLTFSTLACRLSASSQSTDEQPASSAPVVDAPVDSSENTGTDSSAVVPCSQIIPPDELKNLLVNFTPTLTDNSYAGGTSCVWSYTGAAGQSRTFSLNADFSENAVSLWKSMRESELANEPSDIVVNSIDGLADESYVWSSKTTGLYVVYARKGDRTLIMRYVPQDVLYMANESGIIDMVDRFLSRF